MSLRNPLLAILLTLAVSLKTDTTIRYETFLIILLIGNSLILYSQTQLDINKKASDSLQKADKELNEIYKKILVEYKSNTVFIKNLKASQRLWIMFRD